LILYGKEYACHIKKSIQNYSSLPSHNCFYFERCNKELKNVKTNSRTHIERTMAKKFLQTVHAKDFVSSFPPLLYNSDLKSKLENLYLANDVSGNQSRYENEILVQEIEDSTAVTGFDYFDFKTFIGYSVL
jgi:hypothetical protein